MKLCKILHYLFSYKISSKNLSSPSPQSGKKTDKCSNITSRGSHLNFRNENRKFEYHKDDTRSQSNFNYFENIILYRIVNIL